MLADHLIRKKAVLNYLGYGLLFILLIMMVVFSFLAHERIKIWNNDITLWSDALNKYPDGRLNFIYEKRAEQYLIEERYEQALEDYLIIVRQDPGNDNALECVGRIYGKYYNNLDMAIEYLRKANAVNPQNHYALKSLGVAMGLKGDYPRSLEYLLKAYELDKTDTMLLRNIAASYSYLGMPDKAREFQLMSQPKGMK
jgi:tetratricopeptide (TPR) repeat protein